MENYATPLGATGERSDLNRGGSHSYHVTLDGLGQKSNVGWGNGEHEQPSMTSVSGHITTRASPDGPGGPSFGDLP